MREYSGIATIDKGLDGRRLRVTFSATVVHNAANGQDEVDYHTDIALSIDGIDCDRDYLEQTYGRVVTESAIDRAVDNALYAVEV